MAKRFHEGYAGMDSRKAQERQDGSMISEDHSAMANLPQSVVMKPWPDAGSYMPENLDDTITGINAQKNLDDSKRNANLDPKKV
jgi:hypothetical protein